MINSKQRVDKLVRGLTFQLTNATFCEIRLIPKDWFEQAVIDEFGGVTKVSLGPTPLLASQ
jgi:hypothetical protein